MLSILADSSAYRWIGIVLASLGVGVLVVVQMVLFRLSREARIPSLQHVLYEDPVQEVLEVAEEGEVAVEQEKKEEEGKPTSEFSEVPDSKPRGKELAVELLIDSI